MTHFAIRADNLSKQYRMGQQEAYESLHDLWANGPKLYQRFVQARCNVPQNTSKQSIWALKNVSFEVQPGEVVGIIGRNGAGKSTLLKILARITKPTSGRAEGYGRVGCLLEVGTGFHPELSGRENIFLNGAILGMKKREIVRKFDEIVAFAEFDHFLDTPVKRYSSGMYMRLAFAVAAHMEPEILIVDEVLAVGDAAFQKKCLGKMDDVAKQGRTVLFVSHDMESVQALCNRAIFLDEGTVRADDQVAAAIATYLNSLQGPVQPVPLASGERAGERVRLTHVEVLATGGGEEDALGILATGRPAQFIFLLSAADPALSCTFTIYDQFGQVVTSFDSALSSPQDTVSIGSEARFLCEVDTLSLAPGSYRMNATLWRNGEIEDRMEGAVLFEVGPGELMGRRVNANSGVGSVVLHHRWHRPI